MEISHSRLMSNLGPNGPASKDGSGLKLLKFVIKSVEINFAKIIVTTIFYNFYLNKFSSFSYKHIRNLIAIYMMQENKIPVLIRGVVERKYFAISYVIV